MTINLIRKFLNGNTYDIRENNNGRWIDQKCAPDEVRFVSTCVLEFLKTHPGRSTFYSPEIWRSEFARKMVQGYFSKPDPRKETATDEYNKFFRQPLKMLAAAGILSEKKEGIRITFTIKNKHALEFIADSDWQACQFLCAYIEKTLKDSDLWDSFASFFDVQSQHFFEKLKDDFVQFCIDNTPINGRVEAARIFAKVLNPLAFSLKRKGTIRGRMSRSKILFVDLNYNRANWRDVGKAKDQTRQEAEGSVEDTSSAWSVHKASKVKSQVSEFNKKINGGLTEVPSLNSSGQATQMHHIFMQSQFPVISDFRENIVALTPTQHLTMAHPHNNTTKVDPDFQRVCLLAKTRSVQNNILFNAGPNGFYDFERLMEVLDVGFGVDTFTDIPVNDFTTVQKTIDSQY